MYNRSIAHSSFLFLARDRSTLCLAVSSFIGVGVVAQLLIKEGITSQVSPAVTNDFLFHFLFFLFKKKMKKSFDLPLAFLSLSFFSKKEREKEREGKVGR